MDDFGDELSSPVFEGNPFFTAIVITLFSSIVVGSLLSFVPLPPPDFKPLKLIFIKIYEDLKLKKQRNMNSTDDQCGICLTSIEDVEKNYFCFFLPCFHKCCKECSVAVVNSDVKKRIRDDHDDDPEFNGIHRNHHNDGDKIAPSEPFACPFCRQGTYALAPMEVFDDDGKTSTANKENTSIDELSFPKELARANYSMYHRHYKELLSSSNTSMMMMDSKLYSQGLHLGFQKHRPTNPHDWNLIGQRIILLGFVMVWVIVIISSLVSEEGRSISAMFVEQFRAGGSEDETTMTGDGIKFEDDF